MKAIDGNTGFTTHRIMPQMQGHRLNFTIAIPYGCGRVTGIQAVAVLGPAVRSILAALPTPPGNAGKLSLRHRAPGDIFFQAPVASGIHRDDDLLLPGITPADAPLGLGPLANGGFMHRTDILVATDQKTIAAYYVDEANLLAGKVEQYTVDIILKYERRQ
jgi:hypothetical protein